MQTLIEKHKELIKSDIQLFDRNLYKKIDWSHRLIAILGTRGSGKTTCLLQHAKANYRDSKTCLYVDMNDFYFAHNSLTSFIDEFYKKGGKVLLLDQINKYPGWGEELNFCYNHYEDLQIIFAGSSVIQIDKSIPELSKKALTYYIEGLSFREYVNQETGKNFRPFSLEEILDNHEEIVLEILKELRPLALFNDYVKEGYYPFYFDDKKRYSQKLLKFINLQLEVDITYINQVELKYIHKLRKLLYILATEAPLQPNISKLSNEVNVSRATIMNYLKYLQRAQLINLLYSPNENAMKKPDSIFLHNPNLIYTIAPWNASEDHLRKTFFYNQVKNQHAVENPSKEDFLIDRKYTFRIRNKNDIISDSDGSETYLAADMIEIGKERKIPLWLFGFLY